ncbi:hypothetical protein M9Y10_012639 [Tritrichomonas musculus]|uniref:Uncharacterized protein n=1 Tax=Tritrichomonas musculus TaxID=1915356 RepID=A0ABR2GII3_9EUKA
MTDSNAINLKIGMFGGGGVGKTCLTLRYLKGEFSEGYIPTIEDEFAKVVEVNGKTVSLNVIDTAGQDDFAEMRYSYFRQVQGFVFVFDIGNQSSIDDLRVIYNDAKGANDDENIKCVIAANKADLREDPKGDLVSTDEYKKLEDEFKCKVVETSAKTGSGVDELFKVIIAKLIDKDKPAAQPKNTEKKKNQKKGESSEGGCCLIA